MCDSKSGAADRANWATAGEIRGRYSEEASRGFMRRAIANARKAGIEEKTGWPFGAVIVGRDGQVLGDGSNHVFANFDPTAHAEVQAIRAACAAIKSFSLEGCILYTSSEPCPMCLAAAYWSGVDGIVYGAGADDAAIINGFGDAFLYGQFALPPAERKLANVELLRDEAVAVLRDYKALNDDSPS
ncbi:nucleoside deaminase [Paludisphaera soli]|uniref:nucleoside deaminase n=1 Tax=Paludisphaera soli TaxID=2712865 RepID=UPI0013ECB9D1|nr:nucleoside deaminase [Paludisphaera soli]